MVKKHFLKQRINKKKKGAPMFGLIRELAFSSYARYPRQYDMLCARKTKDEMPLEELT